MIAAAFTLNGSAVYKAIVSRTASKDIIISIKATAKNDWLSTAFPDIRLLNSEIFVNINFRNPNGLAVVSQGVIGEWRWRCRGHLVKHLSHTFPD